MYLPSGRRPRPPFRAGVGAHSERSVVAQLAQDAGRATPGRGSRRCPPLSPGVHRHDRGGRHPTRRHGPARRPAPAARRRCRPVRRLIPRLPVRDRCPAPPRRGRPGWPRASPGRRTAPPAHCDAPRRASLRRDPAPHAPRGSARLGQLRRVDREHHRASQVPQAVWLADVGRAERVDDRRRADSGQDPGQEPHRGLRICEARPGDDDVTGLDVGCQRRRTGRVDVPGVGRVRRHGHALGHGHPERVCGVAGGGQHQLAAPERSAACPARSTAPDVRRVPPRTSTVPRVSLPAPGGGSGQFRSTAGVMTTGSVRDIRAPVAVVWLVSNRTTPLPQVVVDALAMHARLPSGGRRPGLHPPRRPLTRSAFGHSGGRSPSRSASKWEPECTPSGTTTRPCDSLRRERQDRPGSLGHASAAEALDTYSHLWPDSDDRTRAAIDSVLGEQPPGDRDQSSWGLLGD